MEDKIIVGKERLEKIVMSVRLKTNNTINSAVAFIPKGREENNSENQIKGKSNQSVCGRVVIARYKIKKTKDRLKRL